MNLAPIYKTHTILAVQVKVLFVCDTLFMYSCLVSRARIMHRFLSVGEAFLKFCSHSHLPLSELKYLLQDPLAVHFEALGFVMLEV